MKKIILLLFLIFIFYQFGLSCTCSASDKSFCDEANSIDENSIIARIQIESREGVGGKARILKLYKGSEEKTVIQIWGGDGGNCTKRLGKVGQIFIMKIRRIVTEYPFSPEMKIGDYRGGSICSNTTLFVEKGIISGVILNISNYSKIEDTDPSKLFFCPLFKSDEQELQSIQITPNPTSNNLTIRGLTSETIISVFDAFGRPLFEKVVSVSNNNLSVTDLTSGLYIIRFRKNTSFIGLKFVKT